MFKDSLYHCNLYVVSIEMYYCLKSQKWDFIWVNCLHPYHHALTNLHMVVVQVVQVEIGISPRSSSYIRPVCILNTQSHILQPKTGECTYVLNPSLSVKKGLHRENPNDLKHWHTLSFLTQQLTFHKMRASSNIMVDHLQPTPIIHQKGTTIERKKKRTYIGIHPQYPPHSQ